MRLASGRERMEFLGDPAEGSDGDAACQIVTTAGKYGELSLHRIGERIGKDGEQHARIRVKTKDAHDTMQRHHGLAGSR